jgi:hypothetical protein
MAYAPYRPNTSAKMRMRIIPTNKRGCCAVPRTPASPTIPIAKPAARPARPTERPAPSWTTPEKRGITIDTGCGTRPREGKRVVSQLWCSASSL